MRLVPGRFLHMIDNENLDWLPGRYEFYATPTSGYAEISRGG